MGREAVEKIRGRGYGGGRIEGGEWEGRRLGKEGMETIRGRGWGKDRGREWERRRWRR